MHVADVNQIWSVTDYENICGTSSVLTVQESLGKAKTIEIKNTKVIKLPPMFHMFGAVMQLIAWFQVYDTSDPKIVQMYSSTVS